MLSNLSIVQCFLIMQSLLFCTPFSKWLGGQWSLFYEYMNLIFFSTFEGFVVGNFPMLHHSVLIKKRFVWLVPYNRKSTDILKRMVIGKTSVYWGAMKFPILCIGLLLKIGKYEKETLPRISSNSFIGVLISQYQQRSSNISIYSGRLCIQEVYWA